ncbi:MAG: class I SAM-dependent methyltransferase, partial [Magnetococcales bacterium]|nr:class I SAM-dependent methyltransferase [Magnetococcales bacterium]
MNEGFTDHFANVAAHYVDSRPTYPMELFTWLAEQCHEHTLAWDCGAGSGQASIELARHFERVIATDASAAQIAQAKPHPRIIYRVASAEESGLPTGSVDLITVAQALHWFDFERFFREVQRLLKPAGIFAAWSYGTLTISGTEVNDRVQHFYHHVVGPYWPPERHHVEAGYQTIPFPLTPLPAPPLSL